MGGPPHRRDRYRNQAAPHAASSGLRLTVELEAYFVAREVRISKRLQVRAASRALRPHGPFDANDYEEIDAEVETWRHVDTLAEADGVSFSCPKCYRDKPGGQHHVLCWFEGRVPDHAQPGPGRWKPSGTGLADLTFVGPRAASVLLQGGCRWHGFVKNGEATII